MDGDPRRDTDFGATDLQLRVSYNKREPKRNTVTHVVTPRGGESATWDLFFADPQLARARMLARARPCRRISSISRKGMCALMSRAISSTKRPGS